MKPFRFFISIENETKHYIHSAGGFVFLVAQAFCLEVAASDATTDLKVQWFNALLRQDMAYYDIKDVSAQATIVSANAARFKRGVGRKLAEGVQFTATVIGGFIYAFYESWEVSLIILTVVPLMAGTAAFLMAITSKQTERKNQNYAETGKLKKCHCCDSMHCVFFKLVQLELQLTFSPPLINHNFKLSRRNCLQRN